jgi:predicted transcriptional regulator of viral defense system
MKNNTIEKYFGPKETAVISRLSYENAAIITIEQFDKWFDFDPALRKQIIFRLKKKGILIAIKRGVYFYSPLESGPAGSRINEFLVAPVFFPRGNYYVGYSIMYNYYGFTDQIFQTMYILNTSLQREKIIGGMRFKMVKITLQKMYGLAKIKIKDTEVKVSDRERTLIDLFYFSAPVGGLKKAFEILEEQVTDRRVNIGKLVKYAAKFPNVSTRKRIGFVLEKAGISYKKLGPLCKTVSKTSFISLFPSKSRKGTLNRKWMVIENVA